MTHAGRSVIVSGSTVAVGLLSMILLPLPFIRSIGIGGMLIRAVSVLAAITLMPALLAMLGERINSVRADAEAVHRSRPSRGRRLGALGALCPAPPLGVATAARDRGRARRARPPAQPERVAAEDFPGTGTAIAGRDDARRTPASLPA